jgi:hypothetical protein
MSALLKEKRGPAATGWREARLPAWVSLSATRTFTSGAGDELPRVRGADEAGAADGEDKRGLGMHVRVAVHSRTARGKQTVSVT